MSVICSKHLVVSTNGRYWHFLIVYSA